MATAKKRRKPRAKGKTPPTFQRKRKRSFSEKAILVLGIIIAVSMILALVVNISGGRVF
jgi:cell division protein FtsL